MSAMNCTQRLVPGEQIYRSCPECGHARMLHGSPKAEDACVACALLEKQQSPETVTIQVTSSVTSKQLENRIQAAVTALAWRHDPWRQR